MSQSKPPELRQRRNKAATRAILAAAPGVTRETPLLPEGLIREETRAWWRDVWASPMAAQFLQADIHALLRLAVLVNQFWEKPLKARELAESIAKQEARFGLTPLDRRRLEWKIEAAPEKPAARYEDDRVDPRTLLRSVK